MNMIKVITLKKIKKININQKASKNCIKNWFLNRVENYKKMKKNKVIQRKSNERFKTRKRKRKNN